MKGTNQKGITLIALIVTIIILVIIAGISIAALTGDNGILRQTNVAKVEQIEGTAREQVKLAVSAMRLAIAEAGARDNSYKASENVGKIQAKLVEILNKDKSGLNGEFGFGGNDLADDANGTELKLNYTGDDYQNACNDTNADIVYEITLGQKTIQLTDETNWTLKDENKNDAVIDVGGNTDNGNGSGGGSATETKLVEVAKIGDYVNYDPTSGGNVNSTNIIYTSVAGSTTKHGNGYGSQTFSATAYKNSGGKWRILEKNSDGTITLISDSIYRDNTDSSAMLSAGDENGLYLQGGIGYLWAEEELHRIGAIYGHGDGADTNQTVTYYYGGPNDQDSTATGEFILSGAEAQQGRKTTLSLDTPSGARALTVDDVNKICGQETTYLVNYSSSTVTKNSNNAKYYPTLNTTNTTTGQSEEQTTFSGNYYYTLYAYRISSTNSDLAAQTKQKEMLKVGTNYWLGSRCVNVYSSKACFGVRNVYSNGDVSINNACNCNDGSWYSNSPSRAVRAVVTLKSGIQTSDATYNESTGWNIK